jgi:oxygen-dependent protoporphyrinogen oxidase
MTTCDVLVVGGGVSGLALAHGLARQGLSVRVWEAGERVGGKIRTHTREGYRFESAATMVVNFRSELDTVLGSAGLDTRMQPRAPSARRYVLAADRLHEVPTRPRELLTTPLLSARGKLALLAEPLRPRGGAPGETVAEFVSRRLGRELLDKFLEPYIAGPLASDAEHAEAVSALPRLTALEQRHGSLVVGALRARIAQRGGSAARPQMFSFAGGMQTLVDTLARDGGFAVEANRRAGEIVPVSGGWRVHADAGADSVFARQLVLSVPADAAAALVDPLDRALATALRTIEYAPIRVVHTGFDRSAFAHPLDGSGFLVPRGSRFAVNGCLWTSSLFGGCAPAGRALLTSYLGGARCPQAVAWDDARALDAVMAMLRALLGVRAEPELLQFERHERALPLYHGRYAQRLAAIDERLARLRGLHLVGNYKGGVSVRDRLLCAEREAARIAQALARTHGVAAAQPTGRAAGSPTVAAPALG